MSGSEILGRWQNKRIRTELASGGAMEGELVRSDDVGVLFALEKLTQHTPAGPVEAEANEESPRPTALSHGPR